jgi:crotonobetainyl-CoA:carnitine CoA-transferase CaiB-like acyl-CoA transferase
LNRLRVVDITSGVAGGYCTRYLGDYGADVIKVEPPRVGEETRRVGPFHLDDPHPEKSLLFLFLNCNKRGVTLDIRSPSGREVFLSLIKDADVLIESYAPGYLAELGLGYETLSDVNPRLVMTSITPFGQTGPYSNYLGNDLISYAMSGIMYTSGAYDREPLKHGHPQTYYMGGMNGAYATLGALYARLTTGRGQQVDVSLQEVDSAHAYGVAVFYSYAGVIERRAPKAEGSSFKGVRFEGIVPTSDGYISPSVSHGRQRPPFADFAELIGHPELDNPHFETPALRVEHAEELDAAVLPVLAEWSRHDFFHKAMEEGWVTGMVQTPEDLLNCPQLEERGYFVELEHPVIGKTKFPGEIFRMSGTPWSLRAPAPLLGQHNKEVYCGELGYTRQALVLLRQQGVI